MRRTAWVATAIVGGCWSAPAAPPPVATREPMVPAIRFALADREARLLRILQIPPGSARVTVEREVAVPDSISHLVWVAPDPAVAYWIDGSLAMAFAGDKETADLPAVPWPLVAKPAKDAADLERGGEHRLFASTHRLVAASCAWKYQDGYEARGPCASWQYARVWPAPVTLLDSAPEDPVDFPVPVVVGARVRAEVVEPKWHEGLTDEDQRTRTTCTDEHGATHALVPPESGAYAIRWFLAEPPIFRLDTTSGSGFGPGYTTHVMYEGCLPSSRYTNAFAGPHGEIVLVGKALAVYRQGKLVARAPLAGDVIAFAP